MNVHALTRPAVIADSSDIDAAGVLSRLQASGDLDSGKVHLISVKAIRNAFGQRWEMRKALVWEMAESQIFRRIGERDFTARLNDETFLLLTPDLEPTAARVLAVRVVREIVSHFLGEAKSHDINVMVANGFDGGQLDCRPLSAEELAEAIVQDNADAADLPARQSLQTSSSDPAEPLADLLTLGGRRLRFSVNVDPIIDLSEFAITGHRIEPKILFADSALPLSPSGRRQLLPRDIQDVDLATVRRGAARLASGQSSSARPSLILTISFLSLSNTSTRTRLLAEAASARESFSRSVIFEVTDFDDGAPAGRLKEGVALLKPFCRAVFARAVASPALAHSARSLGFFGLVFEPPLTLSSHEDEAVWLLAMSRNFETYKGTRVAANLTTKDLLPVASAAGFTHATVRM